METFDQRYRREMENEEIDGDTIVIDSRQDNIPAEFTYENNNSDAPDISMTDKEKYKMFMPILNTIASLVSCHSTTTFLKYVEEFRSMEERTRRGVSVFPTDVLSTHMSELTSPSLSQAPSSSSLHAPSSLSSQLPVPESTINDVQQVLPSALSDLISYSSSSIEMADPSAVADPSIETANQLAENPNAEPASKFKLKFKTALATKGRPQKRLKQLASFNKTCHDRNENSGQQKPSKTIERRIKGKEAWRKILSDVTTYNEEDEEFIGSELLHHDQQDSLNLPQISGDDQNNDQQESPNLPHLSGDDQYNPALYNHDQQESLFTSS